MRCDNRKDNAYRVVEPADGNKILDKSLTDLTVRVRAVASNTDDLLIHRHTANGCEMAVIMFEGLVANLQVSDLLLRPLAHIPPEANTSEKLLAWLRGDVLLASDKKEVRTYGELLRLAMSGFALVVIDGQQTAIALGYQGFNVRGISEPSAEMNLRGSREGFVESIVTNVSMVRRRMKSPKMVVESLTLGTLSNTTVKLLYLSDVVSVELLEKIKKRLGEVKINVLLDSGYLQPFLDRSKFSIFSGVGTTERPDTLCAKISEGRVAVMVDGTPFALIVPYLFVEHFQSLDDYSHRPYFASYVRLLKLVSFFATVLLPGYYVAVVSYHPELIPGVLLTKFLGSVLYTPLPVLAEAIVVFILYELLREAGLRLPRPIGHALGIVGGLVIGDAAVSAGLIGLPMVILIALTAVSSFVVPTLYEPVTVLRFAFIIIGGTLGLYGIYLGLTLFIINLCSLKTLGIPVTAPTTPMDLHSMRDMFVRAGWKKLQEDTLTIQNLPGSDISEKS